MKKADRLNELRVGQTVFLDERGQDRTTVKSIEDKLVAYIVAEDNSCRPLYRGIWFDEEGSDMV